MLEEEVEVESNGLLSRKDLPEVGDDDVLVLRRTKERKVSIELSSLRTPTQIRLT